MRMAERKAAVRCIPLSLAIALAGTIAIHRARRREPWNTAVDLVEIGKDEAK